MASRYRPWLLILLLYILPPSVYCHQKTLRKIVRNQSKMVQRPFSDQSPSGNINWKNVSLSKLTHGKEPLMAPGLAQAKLIHKLQRPKMSTIVSSVETVKSKSAYSKTKTSNKDYDPFEFRIARNTFSNLTTALQPKITKDSLLFSPEHKPNNSMPAEISVGNYYQIPQAPSTSKFFPSVDERELQALEQKEVQKEDTRLSSIIIPVPPQVAKEEISNAIVKRIFIADKNEQSVGANVYNNAPASVELDNEYKADFLIEEIHGSNSKYTYNLTVTPYSCTVLQKVTADIDAQVKFTELDIEPLWMSRKQYWDHIFDSRYESLMRSAKWPPLNVILVPCSHVDSIWRRSFEQYHNNTVNKIISNVVKKLQFYTNLTFTWNEVSHLSQWWKRAPHRSRTALRRLLKSGRLEITTGGWVETDEATSHLFGIVHQLFEGHQWLKKHLSYIPEVGWLTNSVTHSPTLPYLLSASGISKFVMTNLHYSWEQFFAEFQFSDFVWVQDWDSNKNAATNLNQILNRIGHDKYPKYSILTHFLQYNFDNFKACGPQQHICMSDFDFSKSNKNIDINSHNVKMKSEMLLEQYSKTGTITPHNVIIAPIGGRYRYEHQSEFDFQYNNYQRLADFININTNIYKATVEFGTPKDYFDTILNKHKSYPTVKGDFLNFADIDSGSPAYWAGFYTSRPILKILLRRLHSTLRSTEMLLSFAVSLNVLPQYNSTHLLDLLIKARETVARLQDRHVIGGTLSVNTLQYVYKTILKTVRDCWQIQEVAASLLTANPNNRAPYLDKYVYRDGEFTSVFKTISPGDQIYLFNSLSQERTEIIEVITKQPNIRILDYNKKEVTIQINPVWSYNSDNMIKISNRYYKVFFAVVIPPLTLELYKVKDTYDATQYAATIYCLNCVVDNLDTKAAFAFNIQPIQPGDIQLESYKHRIIIDELSGFLKTVVEKDTNVEKSIMIDYGAFKSADVDSGMFLFNTNVTKPLQDILAPFRAGSKTKITIIVAGLVTTEITTIYGRLLQHTIKIFNLLNSPLSNCIYLESKLDYEISPKNRELEVFLSIKTDINNGNHPVIYTDNNGFQYTARFLNVSRRVESNVYPFTSMAFIQDHRSRLTLITDHAQAVTAFQEGHLLVVLDRRVLYNDGKGTREGLADSSATYHRHYLLLENVINSPITLNNYAYKSEVKLPSFAALQVANSVDYLVDMFIVDKKNSNMSYYAFLPLIKISLPCDIAIVTFRLAINKASLEFFAPAVAFLILHRQSFSCFIDNYALLRCDGESNFMLENVLRNVQAVFQTNLVGTDEGVAASNLNLEYFPAMELRTLKVFF